MGLVESAAEYFPAARWQRCMVHFYGNVFSHVAAGKLREVALMLKAIHAQEDLPAAQRKATDVVARLRNMRLGKAAELVETAVPETWAYYAFPEEHLHRIRTKDEIDKRIWPSMWTYSPSIWSASARVPAALPRAQACRRCPRRWRSAPPPCLRAIAL
jgi:transposase-like protein